MDWILSHLWVVVVIAGLVAKVLQAVRGKADGGTRADSTTDGPTFADPDLAERTRKIREEIRRKIEERRGQAGAPTAPDPVRPRLRPEEQSPEATPPPPLVLQLPPVVREVLRPAPSERAPAAAPAMDEAELYRQQALAGQLREIVERKIAAERRAAAAVPTDQEAAALAARRGAVLDDLRDADALRRAILLREVLGPPVALR